MRGTQQGEDDGSIHRLPASLELGVIEMMK